jgi:RNA methyltransferase, TrmH family
MVAEGEDLVEAAIGRGMVPTVVLFDAERVSAEDPLVVATERVAERYAVPPSLMSRASGLAAAPRVIAVIPQPRVRSFKDVEFPPTSALFLAGVADPGNVGTLVRTAAALGCAWVALGPGSADAFHPRAVRAAMGATFSVPILEGVKPTDLGNRSGFTVIAAVPRGGVAPWEADLTGPMVIALGGERQGLEPALEELAQNASVTRVTIPQPGGTESLNVAAAGAALLSEALRQRLVRGSVM